MTFSQRLDHDFFVSVQDRVCERAADAGLDAVFTDDPEDVAYLTGFFHHPCERPVAVWLDIEGRCTLLLPELEREHALAQYVSAELVSYPEYPGVRSPYAALAEAIGSAQTKAGHSTATSYHRLSAAVELSTVEFIPTDVVTVAR